MTEAGEVQTPDPRQPLNELNLAKERQNYGTKYASITVSLCGLERIQNKVIKDLCCRIIPPVKKPNMTITSMPNV